LKTKQNSKITNGYKPNAGGGGGHSGIGVEDKVSSKYLQAYHKLNRQILVYTHTHPSVGGCQTLEATNVLQYFGRYNNCVKGLKPEL
jgi:hypothetical protein